ncbi:MAG: hypothetical protein EHM50_01180 [Lysobacterales bacterium]|nr:MAG: hypothetical protein EHM50_01180 [Xanthomonadales bacterium]
MSLVGRFVFAAALAVSAGAGVQAQEDGEAGSADSSRWSMTVTPYLWAAGLDGGTRANGAASEIDTGYSFLSLDNLDLAVAATPTRKYPAARESWLDPLVGAPAVVEVVPVSLRGDVGGFGVASELAVNLSSTFGYRVTDAMTLRFGYRALHMDFEDGGFVLDAIAQGYTVGLSFAL